MKVTSASGNTNKSNKMTSGKNTDGKSRINMNIEAAEELIEEKSNLLNDLVERNGRLFYTHDHSASISGLTKDERGRFKAENIHAEIVALEQ